MKCVASSFTACSSGRFQKEADHLSAGDLAVQVVFQKKLHDLAQYPLPLCEECHKCDSHKR